MRSVGEGIGSGLLFPGSRTTTVSQPTITAATGTKPHSEDLILDIPNLVATARSSAREHIESVWSDTWLITPLFPAFIPLIVVIGCCCEIFGRAGLMSLSAQVNYYGYGQCLREDQQDLASKVRDEGWVGYMILFLLVLSLIATVFMAIHQSGKISGMVLRKSRKQIAISIAEAVQPLRIG
ncbi:hypothetical protein K435DRAFT_973143 [Dendrothele bispora CBS 962.96]|uniref:Uncharacterized protein n=1 Tax=Dendrothele bispora (strain CBS 962.96) TaxID=1314807 RepID=A0A4S8KVI2_DENBC|nr:hypothetical protein K435DRAFT_973143 [Dendrothele bispora CBS 962.96]